MWILIIFSYIGVHGQGSSSSFEHIEFVSEKYCEKASYEISKSLKNEKAVIKTACVKKGN